MVWQLPHLRHVDFDRHNVDLCPRRLLVCKIRFPRKETPLQLHHCNGHRSVNHLRTGDPDLIAFQHDLYRTGGRGRWWILEQQPGTVNWAPYNPSPYPGMVRSWTHEAFAHGAEVVSYFRWRQAPFAQEQMHSGLQLPNGEPDRAIDEVRTQYTNSRRNCYRAHGIARYTITQLKIRPPP